MAVISASGEVGSGRGISAEELGEVLQRVEDREDIKAVVLRIDSPGKPLVVVVAVVVGGGGGEEE